MAKSTKAETIPTPLELLIRQHRDWQLLKDQLEAQPDPTPSVILHIDYCEAKLVELDAEITLLQS